MEAHVDESWQEWADQFEHGHALVLRIRTELHYHVDGARPESVAAVNTGVWVENDEHLPTIAEQVREVVTKDWGPLTDKLAECGLELSRRELDRMFVAVRLDDEIEGRLRPRPARSGDPEPEPGPSTEIDV